jgi:hypothetical protein
MMVVVRALVVDTWARGEEEGEGALWVGVGDSCHTHTGAM